MALKLGRNDPCHCGSGKKYKRCHLAEDEAREHERREQERIAAEADLPVIAPRPGGPGGLSLPMLPPLPAAPELSPEEAARLEAEEAEYAAWQESIASTDAEGRLQLLDQLLDKPDLDSETVFELFEVINRDARDSGRPEHLARAIRMVAERAPAVYESDKIWYYSWLLELTVAAGRYDDIPELLREIEPLATEHIDEIFRMIDVLMFHDQVDTLIDFMTAIWPSVSDSPLILSRGITEFASDLTMLHVFRHLRAGGAVSAADPGLQAVLEPLGDVDLDRIQLVLDALTGAVTRTWRPSDFPALPEEEDEEEQWGDAESWGEVLDDDDGEENDLDSIIEGVVTGRSGDQPVEAAKTFESIQVADGEPPPLGGPEDPEDEHPLLPNLFQFTLEWAGWMSRERGIPLTRIEMARDILIDYLTRRDPDARGLVRLTPDTRSLDRRLAALASLLSGQYYRAAALFIVMPGYLDYLVEHGLMKRHLARNLRGDLVRLRAQVVRIMESYSRDPALLEAVRSAGD